MLWFSHVVSVILPEIHAIWKSTIIPVLFSQTYNLSQINKFTVTTGQGKHISSCVSLQLTAKLLLMANQIRQIYTWTIVKHLWALPNLVNKMNLVNEFLHCAISMSHV